MKRYQRVMKLAAVVALMLITALLIAAILLPVKVGTSPGALTRNQFFP